MICLDLVPEWQRQGTPAADYGSEVHGTAASQRGCEAEIGHATNRPVKHAAGSDTRLDEELA